jgi:hypothetical protein
VRKLLTHLRGFVARNWKFLVRTAVAILTIFMK